MELMPYLSCVTLEPDPKDPEENERRVVGVIQNVTTKFVMMYDMTKIGPREDRNTFLTLVREWWEESNTLIPVNIFIGRDFDQFYYALAGLPVAGVREMKGHEVNVQKSFGRKIKRRKVEFIQTPQVTNRASGRRRKSSR